MFEAVSDVVVGRAPEGSTRAEVDGRLRGPRLAGVSAMVDRVAHAELSEIVSSQAAERPRIVDHAPHVITAEDGRDGQPGREVRQGIPHLATVVTHIVGVAETQLATDVAAPAGG